MIKTWIIGSLVIPAAFLLTIGYGVHEHHRADAAHAQAVYLAQEVDRQNTAIDSLQAAGKAAAADMAARVKAATSAAQAGRKAASKTVASLKAAKPGVDKCDSALKLIQGVDQ